MKINCALAAWVLIASLGTYMPLQPSYPTAFLDYEYLFALNVAVADGLVFGRDVVFTYGPYASLFSKQYLAATDRLMLLAGAICGLAFACAIVILARHHNRGYLLLAPAMLAFAGDRDSLFITLPLLMLMAICALCSRGAARVPRTAEAAATVSIALCLGLLPLVKATYGALALVATGGAVAALTWCGRSWLAVWMAAAFSTSMAALWIASGQPLWALPGFFMAQVPLVSGFSDAMSVSGRWCEIAYYLLIAAALAGAICRQWRRYMTILGALEIAMVVLTLSVAFKTGFVRHDHHAVQALAVLMLATYFLSFRLSRRSSMVLLAAAFLGWSATSAHHLGYAPLQPHEPIIKVYSEAARGLVMRVFDPGQLDRRFDAAVAQMRERNPLPEVAGSADIYPINQGVLLAHGIRWSPRPVLQSYSAYTDKLARIDADHLTGTRGPDHVFFKIAAIDNRLPSLEDGASWPVLMTRYVPNRMTSGQFALLDRVSDASDQASTTILRSGVYKVGERINLPIEHSALWATLDIQPSLIGRLVRAIYKLPQLGLVVEYEDGRTAEFRYIAPMGQSGFLISPIVQTTKDFLALQSSTRDDYLGHARVKAVRLNGRAGSGLLWKREFALTLSSLQVPHRAVSDKLIYEQWLLHAPFDASAATEITTCRIDSVNAQSPGSLASWSGSALTVSGWLAISARQGAAPERTYLSVEDAFGTGKLAEATRTDRPDVNAALGQPDLGAAGFHVSIDATGMDRPVRLRLYGTHQDAAFVCNHQVQVPASR